MNKNPLRIIGQTAKGIPIMGGLFKMADTNGFPLTCSIDECRKRGVAPGLPAYVADAVAAGWPLRRAIKTVREAISDSGETLQKGEWAVLKRDLRIAGAQPWRYGTPKV